VILNYFIYLFTCFVVAYVGCTWVFQSKQDIPQCDIERGHFLWSLWSWRNDILVHQLSVFVSCKHSLNSNQCLLCMCIGGWFGICSVNVIGHVKKVKLRRAQLVLGLVTTFGGYDARRPGIFVAHSAWLSFCGLVQWALAMVSATAEEKTASST